MEGSSLSFGPSEEPFGAEDDASIVMVGEGLVVWNWRFAVPWSYTLAFEIEKASRRA
jgi:hypothetical protein